MAKESRSERMVTVTVARGNTIQQRECKDPTNPVASDPVRMFGPGKQCQVPAREVEGLIKRGVILNPEDKPLPKDAGDVDISNYFKSSEPNAPTVSERSTAPQPMA